MSDNKNLNNDFNREENNTDSEKKEFVVENNSYDENKSEDNLGSKDRTYIYDTNFVVEDKNKSKKSGKKGGVAPYIAIALICSLLGGAIGGGVTYSALKQGKADVIVNEKNEKKENTGVSLSNVNGINIPEIAEKVSPAVVAVTTKSIPENFFGWQGQPQEAIGSGFIFNEEGLVLTNYHVVKGASEVKVVFNNGKEVTAKVVNYNENADLAVVKITEKTEIPGVAKLGNSDDLKVGEQVVAIGSPLSKDFSGSVTTGIISAMNREIQFDNGKTLKLIQTDTAINPGNSGGPLVNSKGEVIGINTAKIDKQGVEGLGFAIPINEAISQLDTLTKPILKLGIHVKSIDEELSKETKLPIGVYIAKVDDFGVAQKGGLQPGDVIVKFDGKSIKNVDELNKIKASHKEGDVVRVDFVRDGKNMQANLKLES